MGNVTTTWSLSGDLCVSTITTTTSPTADAADATYTCPTGFVPDGWTPPSTGVYPGDSTCVQSPAPVPTDQWTCPAGYTPLGWTSPSATKPPEHSCVTYKTVDIVVSQDAIVTSYSCGSNKTIGSEIGLDPAVCYQWTHRDNQQGSWQATGVQPQASGWSCPAGWTGPNRDHKCTQVTGTEQVVDHRTNADKSQVCAVPDSVGPACVNPPPTCTPARTNPVKADHYFCAAGYAPTGEVAATATCTKVEEGTSQNATCPVAGDVLTNGSCVTPLVPAAPVAVVPGGPAPTIDYCPNLDGVQWEGYDCAVPAAPVTAVEAATVAAPVAEPVPVVAPEPATVPEETETVTAPQPATTPAEPVTTTVPTAVQAGGGSTADDGTVPAWAFLLVALGALGLAGATTRLLKAPVR